MSHEERLADLIAAHQLALAGPASDHVTHAAILRILTALEQSEIPQGQALRMLDHQARRMADTPAHGALYRQAAADLRQMQCEER
jgi:hypothetical protein